MELLRASVAANGLGNSDTVTLVKSALGGRDTAKGQEPRGTGGTTGSSMGGGATGDSSGDSSGDDLVCLHIAGSSGDPHADSINTGNFAIGSSSPSSSSPALSSKASSKAVSTENGACLDSAPIAPLDVVLSRTARDRAAAGHPPFTPHALPSIHVMKVDVEGYEMHVLDGAGELFGSDRRPCFVIAEYSREMVAGMGDATGLGLFRRMERHGCVFVSSCLSLSVLVS